MDQKHMDQKTLKQAFKLATYLGTFPNLETETFKVKKVSLIIVEEFNALLYQIMINDKTNDIATNKKLQLHFAMKNDVQFTACGFFTIDYTLVHSMIAATTTYLVILIQFREPTTSVDIVPDSTFFANSTFPTLFSTTSL
ncbi:unnamed protein product [Nezara viridula]|uniref:Uncharacterized protein n=1 Tax=Nezara viridula TaxID=85310 RepID=A0A9P0MP95_NEZVI|nr:unnamed protein product [Nezara viridula]